MSDGDVPAAPDGQAPTCSAAATRWREQLPAHLTVALLDLLVLAVIVARLRDPRDAAVRVEPPPSLTPPPTATAATVNVYVTGAVERPKVVVLAPGARAVDAVSAAGGPTSDADISAINLAQPLADGQQLRVPRVGDPTAPSAAASGGGVAVPSGEPQGAAAVGGGAGYVASAAAADVAGAPGRFGGKLDINMATVAELESLTGVGPSLAARIVAYREEHGAFGRAQDLLNVTGIGEKTLARFRDEIALP